MNYQEIKKRLLVESGILSAIVLALGVGVYCLDSFTDDYEKSKEDLANKVAEISASTNALSNKYDKVKNNKALYEKITQLEAVDGLSINQQAVKNYFNHLRDQYYLSNLHLSVSPITEMQGADYRRTTNIIVSSDVNITFDGLSDEYAYSLIDALQHDLPGGCKIAIMTLTRTGSVTGDALHAIADKGTYQLIKGEIKFVWLGVKPVESNDSGTNAAAPKP